MSWFIVDCEMNGPAPGLFSMVSLGAVKLDKELKTTFYAEFAPISMNFKQDALDIVGVSFEETLNYPPPIDGMIAFRDWIKENNTRNYPIFVADNPAGDFAFVNYYFHLYELGNPFGWSARRISDLYCGFKNDMYSKWKHLRKTKHTHNPVDDAMGNAEALLAMQEMGLNLKV